MFASALNFAVGMVNCLVFIGFLSFVGSGVWAITCPPVVNSTTLYIVYVWFLLVVGYGKDPHGFYMVCVEAVGVLCGCWFIG